jgi:hypothetical protein
MDYSELLFALQIRNLALDMMYAENPSWRNMTTTPDQYENYVGVALREAESTARYIAQKRCAQS